jgi:hypothetical protein
MTKQSFFEISTELRPLEDALEAAGGEVDGNEGIVERVTDLLTATQQKVDAYGFFAKGLEMKIKALKAYEDEIAQQRQVFENKLRRLKDAAKSAMEVRGIVKVEGEIHTISLQKNGGKPPLNLKVDEDKLPKVYIRWEPMVDKDAIRADLIAGNPAAQAIAELGEVGSSIRIR